MSNKRMSYNTTGPHSDTNNAVENPNVEAEQMETLAEGKVASAVEKKSGAQKADGKDVHIDDFASDLGKCVVKTWSDYGD